MVVNTLAVLVGIVRLCVSAMREVKESWGHTVDRLAGHDADW